MLIKFEIYKDEDYWCARGIGVDIFTQGKTLDELMEEIKEAVEVHYDEEIESGQDIRVLSISEFEVGPVEKIASC